MQRSTFSTQVYCRPSKADRKGLSPLELGISVNSKRVFVQLPYRCRAKDFNRKRRPKELQAYVDATQANINGILLDMAQNGIPVTAVALREYFRSGGFKTYTVNDLFTDFLRMMKGRVGKDITQGAYRKYELVRDLFISFHKGESEVASITPSVAQEFYSFLQGKYNPATSASYIAKFHTVTRYAIDNNRLKINPFQNIKVRHPRKQIDYLTQEELDAIWNVKIDNDCLNSVRDAFMLQCYSGLSYIDLEHLQESDIRILPDGTHLVQKDRIKTGIPYTAVILPRGVEILMRNGYNMRVISNQKMNVYLKQIMTLAGVNHSLHTHLGRKTYGHILLNSGVRLETTAKCLGHSSSRTTARYYAEVTTDTVVSEVTKAFA